MKIKLPSRLISKTYLYILHDIRKVYTFTQSEKMNKWCDVERKNKDFIHIFQYNLIIFHFSTMRNSSSNWLLINVINFLYDFNLSNKITQIQRWVKQEIKNQNYSN